jgi:hypothetical protein
MWGLSDWFINVNERERSQRLLRLFRDKQKRRSQTPIPKRTHWDKTRSRAEPLAYVLEKDSTELRQTSTRRRSDKAAPTGT